LAQVSDQPPNLEARVVYSSNLLLDSTRTDLQQIY